VKYNQRDDDIRNHDVSFNNNNYTNYFDVNYKLSNHNEMYEFPLYSAGEE